MRYTKALRPAVLALIAVVLAHSTAAAQVPDAEWERIATSGQSPDRAFHTMVYDRLNQTFWVFGGVEQDFNSNRFSNALYALDATDPDALWRQVSISGLRPEPLALHSAIYDPLRQRMVVYGGLLDRNRTQSQQAASPTTVWLLDLADPDDVSWSSESVPGNPVSRFGHAAVYVEDLDAMVVSGGARTFTQADSSNYALMLGEEPMRWIRMANAGFTPRAGHSLVYDTTTAQLISYGGLTNFDTVNTNREVLSLDLAAGLDGADQWRRLTTQTPALQRAFMAAAFDPDRRLWWIHGGIESQNTIFNDLSVLDLNQDPPTWRRTLEIIDGPLNRFAHVAAWDGSRDRAVFQGGSPDNQRTLSDTRALNMLTEATATPSASPTNTSTSTPTSTDAPPATATGTTTAPTATATGTTTVTSTPTPSATDDSLTVTPSPTRDETATATTAATATPTESANAPVNIEAFQFVPDPIVIDVGTTVTWTNRDAATHTTTSGAPGAPSGLWDSGDMQQTDDFTHTFLVAGRFPYYCRIHPSMVGTVIVIGAEPEPEPGPIYLPLVMRLATGFGRTATPSATPTDDVAPTPTVDGTAERTVTAAPTNARTAIATPTSTRTPTPTPTVPAVTAEVIGQVGGEADAVAVVGDRVYLGMGPRLLVIDASNPNQPTLLGQSEVLTGVIAHIAIDGNRAFVAHSYGVTAFDVSNPTLPTRLAPDIDLFRPAQVVVRESLAYIAYRGGLAIYDVTDPAAPTQLASFSSGSTNGVAVENSLAFLARNQGLVIVDVTDPTAPVTLGDFTTTRAAHRVAVAGTTAYLANDRDGLRVLNVSDATAPVELGLVETPVDAMAVQVSDGLAFVATGFGGLSVVDVSQPAAPEVIGTFASPGRITSDLALVGDTVYLADGGGGLRIVNATDPAQPAALGAFDSPGRAVALEVNDQVAWVGYAFEGLQALSVGDPANPTQLSYLSDFSRVEGIEATDSRLYVAQGNTFDVLDVSNATAPTELGSITYPEYANDVRVDGNVAYVAELFRGLGLWDVTDPANIAALGNLESPGRTNGIDLVSNRAFLADADGGLQIVDVSDPATPAQLGALALPADAQSVAVVGTTAFLAGSGPHLQAVDISDAAQPQALGSLDGLSGHVIKVQGTIAYIGHFAGLQIVDVANPNAPTVLLNVPLPGRQFGLEVDGDLIYLAGDGGFLVLQVTLP